MDDALVDTLWMSTHLVAVRAACGMLGSMVLVLALPPKMPGGGINYNYVLQRLFAGAFLPVFMGPWMLKVLQTNAANVMLHEYPELVFFLLGTLSYFLFRWLAIWLDRNKDKDIEEIGNWRRPPQRGKGDGDANE